MTTRNDVNEVSFNGVVISSTPVVVDITIETNDATLRADPQAQINALVESIAALQLIVDATNATINANPAVAIKALAREQMTLTRRVVRLARLQLGALDSTDGTE